ncbi:hypothetical protein [Inediibacterium massiliense]|uniref:hypothetical protein n=1 Tax=Inediibacterium massiliense TaxID=1658111 RepID=UPI0006B47C50|nr:hypothetical protein [Inediibacterium massiliense]
MVNLHQYAIQIEQRVRRLIGPGTERFALGGIVNSDFIEYGGIVTAIVAGLSTYYHDKNIELIDAFLENIIEYNGVNFRDIGEETVKNINDQFRELANKIERNR